MVFNFPVLIRRGASRNDTPEPSPACEMTILKTRDTGVIIWVAEFVP